jgi:alpha-beta hydrolase superfamily lysophospholipase
MSASLLSTPHNTYQGFGTASLNQDAHELKLLVEWLVNEEGSTGVVLMGHSTGGVTAPRSS